MWVWGRPVGNMCKTSEFLSGTLKTLLRKIGFNVHNLTSTRLVIYAHTAHSEVFFFR